MPLSPKQKRSIVESLDGDARVNVWHGSIRSGKTTSSILAWCEYVQHAPSGHLIMMGQTVDTLARNVLDELDAYFGADSPLVYTRGANVGTLFGRTVHMIGAKDRSVESRIRGITSAGAYVDEGTLLPGAGTWHQLRGRHLTVPDAKLFVTTNPDHPSHWFKKEVLDGGAEAGVKDWHFDLNDNPLLGDKERAEIAASMTGLWRRRFIDGLWVAAEGAIYEGFDTERHVAPAADLHPDHVFAVGIDHGMGAQNTRGYLIGAGLHPLTGDMSLMVLDEWAPGKLSSPAAQAKAFREWIGTRLPEWVVVDPAAAGLRGSLHDAGIDTTPGHNAVMPGIGTISNLLDSGRLVIADTCTDLIETMPGYVWDPKAAERGEDKPLKRDDHCVDALRYGIYTTRRIWSGLIPVTIPEVADYPEKEAS